MIDLGGDGGGLGPEARALLDLARGGLSPDPAAIARVRGRLGAATGAVAGTALGVKLALLATVVVAAAGAGLALRRDRVAAVAPPRIELATIEVTAPAAAPVYEVAPPALPPRPPIVHHVARPRPPAIIRDEAAVVPAEASLAREVELIDLAMASLRNHHPDDALRAVQRHAVETRDHGQLAEDAAAIEIEALCQLHATTTADKLEAFDARFPRSAQRSRLTTRCPGSP